MLKVKAAVLFLIVITCFAGCNNVSDIDSKKVPPPQPVETPFKSISGAKCDVTLGQLFSIDGRSVFSECEVRRNPDIFNGKKIRIAAEYGFMIHGSYLHSDDCELSDSIDEVIWLGISEADWNYLRGFQPGPVEVTAIGSFSFNEPSRVSDAIYDRTPYHFSVTCLTNASTKLK